MARSTSTAAAAPDTASLLFFARFAALEEPRKHAHKIVYRLEVLLLGLFGAALSGMEGWEGAADFARLKEGWLRALCPWEGEGTPSADTFERVIGKLDADMFAECFGAWMRDIAARRTTEGTGVQHLALDGKTMAGAKTPGAPSVPMHLVHTYLVEGREGLLVGLAPAPGGASGEGRSAADLLGLLELEDTVVTGDANFLSGRVVEAIVEGGGDYVLALKGNRGPQHREVKGALCTQGTDALDEARARALAVSHFDAGEESGHGRTEHRRAWAFAPAHFPEVQRYLPSARSVLALCRERMSHTTGEVSEEVAFHVSSRPPTEAQAMAGWVRAHWGVENALHRELDVVLHEDAVRVGAGPGAQNLAVVRRAALAAIQADTTFKASKPRRARQAAHDDGYRTHLLTLTIS